MRSSERQSASFLQRVVPAILENTPGFKAPDPHDLVGSFLAINRDLRRENAETIAAYARKSAPQILWKGAFAQLGNSQVEALFADHRTYVYQGKEIDRQVHLGFDLAVTANVPVLAANDGRVLHADYLGIYGNCVILDHGFGVQTLYGHLSSIDVKAGDAVHKLQPLGRSGMTGLAGGDHLHFTMLVDGRPVSACTTLAFEVRGRSVLTIEGLAVDGKLHPLQQAFINHGGFQCGFCTPGMILASKALLDENPHPSEEELKHFMHGNICRCTGYKKIIESIMAAAKEMSPPSA